MAPSTSSGALLSLLLPFMAQSRGITGSRVSTGGFYTAQTSAQRQIGWADNGKASGLHIQSRHRRESRFVPSVGVMRNLHRLEHPLIVKSEAVNGGGVEDTSTGKGFLRSVYKFTRPHTIRGTILASFAGVARVLLESPTAIDMQLIPRASLGLLTLLFGNIYIVGINQIFDKEIDKINKPFLPVAAGEMTKRVAWVIVLLSGIGGLALCKAKFGSFIFALYSFGLFIGTIYSIPPFFLKQNAVAAGAIIATVRGFLLNFGVYYAAREALGLGFVWSPAVSFVARFMTIFAMIIAVTKDLPDIKGDKEYGVKTFATRLGPRKVAKYASIVLGLNYVHAIATGLLFKDAFNLISMVGGHAVLGLLLIRNYRLLDPDSQFSIKKFYARIWNLFYLEYALYPFI